QATFFAALHSSGGVACGASPVPSGPRHWGQKRAASGPVAAAGARASVRMAAETAKLSRRGMDMCHSTPEEVETFTGPWTLDRGPWLQLRSNSWLLSAAHFAVTLSGSQGRTSVRHDAWILDAPGRAACSGGALQ